jgi:hypothetical protein
VSCAQDHELAVAASSTGLRRGQSHEMESLQWLTVSTGDLSTRELSHRRYDQVHGRGSGRVVDGSGRIGDLLWELVLRSEPV